jgi:hypothetical protein
VKKRKKIKKEGPKFEGDGYKLEMKKQTTNKHCRMKKKKLNYLLRYPSTVILGIVSHNLAAEDLRCGRSPWW